MSRRDEVVVVVVAAGMSSRFGSDKLAERIGDVTVLDAAVASVRRPLGDPPTVLVVPSAAVGAARLVWEPRDVVVAAGGALRQDSVRRGFQALDPDPGSVVVIHDAARPYVPAADVGAVVDAARRHGAALLVAPLPDTIKRIDEGGTVLETIPRQGLARALTPQAFTASLLVRAWRAVGKGSVWTDEASMIEAQGWPVQSVVGDGRNVKVTVPGDLEIVRSVVEPSVRTGMGIDVHPFAEGRRLVLCGVELPGAPGLDGHSDADVALHAVTDAILGACAAGDIGVLFPPSDPRWRDADSSLFVGRALEIARERGWRLSNCDVTILAERPRLTPHRANMVARLARLLEIDADAVGIKATTTEGLGFVGRTEGIAATAVVTLVRR